MLLRAAEGPEEAPPGCSPDPASLCRGPGDHGARRAASISSPMRPVRILRRRGRRPESASRRGSEWITPARPRRWPLRFFDQNSESVSSPVSPWPSPPLGRGKLTALAEVRGAEVSRRSEAGGPRCGSGSGGVRRASSAVGEPRAGAPSSRLPSCEATVSAAVAAAAPAPARTSRRRRSCRRAWPGRAPRRRSRRGSPSRVPSSG